MKANKIELWVTDDQLQRWNLSASYLNMTIWEYMRKSIDAYSTIMYPQEQEMLAHVVSEPKPK